MKRAAILLAIGLLLAPGVHGESLDGVSASAMRASNAITEAHVGFLAWHAHASGDGTPIALQADTTGLEGTLYEKRQLQGAIGPLRPGPTQPEVSHQAVAIDAAWMSLEAVDPDHQIVIEGDLDASLMTVAGAWAPVKDAYYDANSGFDIPDGGDSDADAAEFRNRHLPGEQILARSEDPTLRLTAAGTVVMELQGIDLLFMTPEGEQRISTRPYVEKVHALQPDGSTETLRVMVEPFLRVTVQVHDLEVLMAQAAGEFFWAAETMAVEADGPVALEDAQGVIVDDGVRRTLAGDDVVLDRVGLVALAPAEDRMSVHTVSTPDPGLAAATKDLARSPWAWSAVGIVGILLAYVMLRAAPLARVESAIEDGRYRRAARMARRRLAKMPGDERAMVARAVALSKAGDHDQVVAEVEQRLATSEPSDGVLHYLAGLSHLEKGQGVQARRLFKEAVRRTPALSDTVSGLLRTPRPDQEGYV